MSRENETWFDRPYETWRQNQKASTEVPEQKALARMCQSRLIIVCVAVLALPSVCQLWVIFSDVTLWDKDWVSSFYPWMFALFLVGNPLGLYLAAKLPHGPLYFLQLFAIFIGGVGALGMLLLPVFLYANYILDFSEPETIAATVTGIKMSGTVGKMSPYYTLTMTQKPFETQTISDQQRKYSHLRVGEHTWLVTGRGLFGIRYVREIRSNITVKIAPSGRWDAPQAARPLPLLQGLPQNASTTTVF